MSKEKGPLATGQQEKNKKENSKLSQRGPQNQTIYSFHKNSIELIKICLVSFPGRKTEYLDLRIWRLENPASPGSEVATHKGICLDIEFLPDLIKSLKEVEDFLNART